jgi:hypothetical protein
VNETVTRLALRDRPKDADYIAQSRWRSQPAIVIKGGKIQSPAVQGSAAEHEPEKSNFRHPMFCLRAALF